MCSPASTRWSGRSRRARVETVRGARPTSWPEDVSRCPVPAAALRAARRLGGPRGRTTDAGSYAPAPLPRARRASMSASRLPAGCRRGGAARRGDVRNGNRAEALAPVVAGDGVLPAGADVDRERGAAPRGRAAARPSDVAVLAAAGVGAPCTSASRACVWCAPGGGRRRHRCRRGACIAGAIARRGRTSRVRRSQRWPRSRAAAMTAADAVIAIGGTGSGRHDASVHDAGARRARSTCTASALVPGETAAFGRRRARGRCCCCRAGSMRRSPSGSCSGAGCWRGCAGGARRGIAS